MGWQDVLAKHHPIPAFFAAVISNIVTGNKAEENENTNDINHHNGSSSYDHDYTYGSSAHQPAQYYYPPTQSPSTSSHNNFPRYSSSPDYDNTYRPSEIQPQYYYPPTPRPSSSSHNKIPKKTKSNTYNQGQQIDYYNNGMNDGYYNNNANNGYYNNGANNGYYNNGMNNGYYNNGVNNDYYNNSVNNEQQIVKSKGVGLFWRRKDEHVVDKGKGRGQKGKVMRSYMDQNGQEVVEERDYEIQTYYELQMSPAKVVDKRKNKDNYQGAGKTRYYY